MKSNKTPTTLLKQLISCRETLFRIFVITYHETNFSQKTINAALDIRGPVASTGAGLFCYSTKYRNLALKILKDKN